MAIIGLSEEQSSGFGQATAGRRVKAVKHHRGVRLLQMGLVLASFAFVAAIVIGIFPGA